MESESVTYKRWKEAISNEKYTLVLEEFQKKVEDGVWSLQNEILLASKCLVQISNKTHKVLKINQQNEITGKEIFNLTEFCCKCLSKSWKDQGYNFLASIFFISQYFFPLGLINEIQVISSYAFQFADSREMKQCTNTEIIALKNILYKILEYLNTCEITKSNFNQYIDLWKFVYSPSGRIIKESCIDKILAISINYIGKLLDVSRDVDHCLMILRCVNELNLSNVENSTLIKFLTICRVIIPNATEHKIKDCIEIVIISINKFSEHCNSMQKFISQFCCNICRLSICQVTEPIPNFLIKCNQEILEIFKCEDSILNNLLYFISVVLFNTRQCWSNCNNFFYSSCEKNLYEFLLYLAEKVDSIDVENKFDDLYILYLADFVLKLTFKRIEDIDKLKFFYPLVKKAVVICCKIACFEIDKKKNKSHRLGYIGPSFCNISRLYYIKELYMESKELSLIAAKALAKIPSSDLSDSEIEHCVEKLISYLFSSYEHLNDKREALKTACIWAAKFPAIQKPLMCLFASLKAKIFLSSSKDCLDIICNDILLEQPTCSIWKDMNLEKPDITTLSKLELECYSQYHVAAPEPIEKIINLAKGTNIIINCMITVTAVGLYTENLECLKNATNMLPRINAFIDKLMNYDEKVKIKKPTYSILLGNLFYMKFRITLLSVRSENEEEVQLFSAIKAPVLYSELGNEQESRDVAHVLHKSLTYESQIKITEFLDIAIQHWQNIDEEAEKNSVMAEKLSVLGVFSFIKEAALLYRLYKHKVKELKCWKILYNLAIMHNDINTAVDAFSYLLSMPEKINEDWEAAVKQKLHEADQFTQVRYQIEFANRLLQLGRAEEGLVVLEKINGKEIKNHIILFSRYSYVLGQYLRSGFCKTQYTPMLAVLRSQCLLSKWIKTGSWTTFSELCESQVLLLDVTLFIGTEYTNSYLIRYAKCYLKEHINLIQRLGLPLRICDFLIAICQLNLFTCNMEDCYVQLDALKNVLKFSIEESIQNRTKKNVEKVVSRFDCYSDVRFISEPHSSDNFSSPILENALKFEKPNFLNHLETCDCPSCTDFEYQKISCQFLSLGGVYFQKMKKPGQSLKCFEDTLEMNDVLRNRWHNLCKIDECRLFELKLITKLRLGDFWASCREYKKAVEINENALKQYEELVLPNKALYWELKQQYWALRNPEPSQMLPSVLKRKPKLKPEELDHRLKTPMTKSSIKVYEDKDESLSKLVEKIEITPLPCRSRKNLFANDPEFAVPKNPSNSRVKKTSSRKKIESPPDIVMRVPSSVGKSSVTKKTKKKEEKMSTPLRYNLRTPK